MIRYAIMAGAVGSLVGEVCGPDPIPQLGNVHGQCLHVWLFLLAAASGLPPLITSIYQSSNGLMQMAIKCFDIFLSVRA